MSSRLIVIGALGLILGSSGAARVPSCRDKCKARHGKCSQAYAKQHNACTAKAERYKRKALKRAAKSKDAENARARVRERFEQKVAACLAARSTAKASCKMSRVRCEARCGKPSRRPPNKPDKPDKAKRSESF